MLLLNPVDKQYQNERQFPKAWREKQAFFVLCSASEVPALQQHFGFDDSTVLDCTDLDESVRFTSYKSYDFMSVLHMEATDECVLVKEINMYVSASYVILVMPDGPLTGRIQRLQDRLTQAIAELDTQENWLNRALYTILYWVCTDYAELLEALEDQLEELEQQIIDHVEEGQFQGINHYRKLTYTLKKQLRASSYLGEQLLINANGFIGKGELRYFHNINTRLKKLYDFSESLYEFDKQLLNAYDSKLAGKTNQAVNKLTILTVFFGPLTIITGIYGMNFDIMPELRWSFGYPAAMLLMLLVTTFVYWVLKRNEWL